MMIPVSLELPVRAHEASQLADLIFQFAETRTVDDALRRMLASRATQTPFESMRVYWGSLAADPVASSTYYVAVDGKWPVLLHITTANSPAAGQFRNPALIGRMRTPRGVEVVVNAIPFSASESGQILTYAQQLDRSILPRPQGGETFYLAAGADGDTAFAQFRAVQKKYGLSVAAFHGAPSDALYGAIRHGWREGFALAGDDELSSRTVLDATSVSMEELEDQIDALRKARGRNFDIDVRFDGPGEITRADVLAGRLERLRSAGRSVQVVFVELGLQGDKPYPARIEDMAGWPAELLSNVQWKAGGKPLVELRLRVEELQQAARGNGAIIGVVGQAALQEEALEAIGAGAQRRLWFQLGEGMPASRITELAACLRG